MEKQKLNINFWWMLVVVLLIIVISSAISIMVCQYIEKDRISIPKANELTTTPKQNEEENKNQEEEGTKLIIPITLNNHKHELVVVCTLGEKQYYGPMGEDEEYPDMYPQTIKVSMDGKDYKILDNNELNNEVNNSIYVTKNMPAMANIPKVVGIKSKEGKEYIAITPELSENQRGESMIYILDENGEIIGKIKDYGKTSFSRVLDDISIESIPAYTINNDSIDIIKPTKDYKGAEVQRYIIEEGKIKVEGIIKKYTEEEIRGAGSKYGEEEIESDHIY